MISAIISLSAMQDGALVTQPVPLTQPSTWIQAHDYSESVNGRTVVVLEVDTQGRVFSCTIQSSSGSSTLDRIVCQRAKERARFRPARDEQGAAVSGSYLLPVLWGKPSINIRASRNRLVFAMSGGKAGSCVNYDENGLVPGQVSNSCHTPTDLLTRYFGDDYKRADRLTIETMTISGSGQIDRAAPDGRRITLRESAVTIADDGTPQACEERVALKEQKGSLEGCIGYQAGHPFIGLKKFVSAIDWTLHFPNTSGNAAADR